MTISEDERRPNHAQQWLDDLLAMRARLPDTDVLIDAAANTQLGAIGGIEAMVARRAERDLAVAQTIHADETQRLNDRQRRSTIARQRSDQIDAVAAVFTDSRNEGEQVPNNSKSS